MDIGICFGVSVAIFCLSIIAFFISKCLRKSMSIYLLYFGVFLANIPLFLPGFSDDGIIKMIFSSMNESIKMFFMSEDMSVVIENSKGYMYATYLHTYSSIISFVCIIITLSTVLELAGAFFSDFKYAMRSYKKVFIFSELNDRTYEAACSLKNGRCVVFTNISKGEISEDLLKKAGKMGAVCLKKDIENIKIPRFRRRKMNFYFWSENEEKNIAQAMCIANKLEKSRARVKLFVFSTKEEAEIIVDSYNTKYINKKNINIFYVNEYKMTIQDLFYKRPLFIGAKNNKISILILGSGMIGEEALKMSIIFGQLYGYELEINVVSDNIAELKDKLYITMPEIINKPDEYHINFVAANVLSKDFGEFLLNHGDVNYVIVSLGNDSLNVETAVNLRTMFMRTDNNIAKVRETKECTTPVINVFLDNIQRRERVHGLANINGINYNLYTFGRIDGKLDGDWLFDKMYGVLAQNTHYVYCREEDFKNVSLSTKQQFKYEYNRKGSMVSSIHTIYKLFYCFKDKYPAEYFINEGPSDFYKRNVNMIKEYDSIVNMYEREILFGEDSIPYRLTLTEHMVWCANSRVNGYVKASLDEVKKYYELFYPSEEQKGIIGNHTNTIAKMHPCLVRWELDSPKVYDDNMNDELDHISLEINNIKKNYDADAERANFKLNNFRRVKGLSRIYRNY